MTTIFPLYFDTVFAASQLDVSMPLASLFPAHACKVATLFPFPRHFLHPKEYCTSDCLARCSCFHSGSRSAWPGVLKRDCNHCAKSRSSCVRCQCKRRHQDVSCFLCPHACQASTRHGPKVWSNIASYSGTVLAPFLSMPLGCDVCAAALSRDESRC